MKDWQKITKRMIERNHGVGLLNFYNGNMRAMLETLYPEYPWQPWQIGSIPGMNWMYFK